MLVPAPSSSPSPAVHRSDDTWPEELLIPRGDGATLARLVPAIGAHLTGGSASGEAAEDPFGLPHASRYVLLLVDGMGEELLEANSRLAPQLSGMQRAEATVTCAVPSTTATSLSCLGTGCLPGRHGVLGYTFRSPVGGMVMNALSWQHGDDPLVVQPHPTAFEELSRVGVAVSSVGPERFEKSGLTRASLRGPAFLGVRDEHDIDLRVDLARQGSEAGEPSLCYVYERSLDHVGHGHGCASTAWRRRLGWVDELVQALSEGLAPGTVLIVTADHGMIDVPTDHRILIEDEPGLSADLDEMAGEPRFRQLYTRRPEQVAARWADQLGEQATVLTAQQAIDLDLFGVWDPVLRNRLGDVLVAMRGDWAVMTQKVPQELGLVGMHGSLTRAEMTIPLRWQTIGAPVW